MNKIENLIYSIIIVGLIIGFVYAVTPELNAGTNQLGICEGDDYCDYSQNGLFDIENSCSKAEDCCTDERAGCAGNQTSFWLQGDCVCLDDQYEPGDPSGGDPNDPQPTPTPTNNNGTGNTNIGPPYEGGPQTIMDVIESITDWVLGIAGALAVLFIIISGIRYITSAGNQNLQEAAKKNLTSAIIGLVIVLLAFVIVQVLARVLTS